VQPLVLSGARTLVSINGQPFAAGYVLDYAIDYLADELLGVDSVLPEELAPGGIRVSANLRVFRTPENDPTALNIAPKADQMSPQAEYSKSGYITIEIRDRVTDKTVLFLPRARVLRRTGSVQAEDLLSENWSIRGIGFMGPGDTSLAGAIFDAFGSA
jgi:hypothetical protein